MWRQDFRHDEAKDGLRPPAVFTTCQLLIAPNYGGNECDRTTSFEALARSPVK